MHNSTKADEDTSFFDLKELLSGIDTVIFAGFFGSFTRSPYYRDIDVLLITEQKISLNHLKDIRQLGYEPIVIGRNELGTLDPIFIYSIRNDIIPIFGALPQLPKVDHDLVVKELKHKAAMYVLKFRQTIKENAFWKVILAETATATKYASWLLLVSKGQKISNNPLEMKALLDSIDMKIAKNFSKTAFFRFHDEFSISNADKNDESNLSTILNFSLNFIEEVFRMTTDPMKEASNWLNHVKKRITEFKKIDEYIRRDLCQGLFMIVYELTRAYLMHVSTKLPETHAEIFHVFESRKDIDPFLSKISDIYSEAFHYLHIDCHYKGQVDDATFFDWLRKIEDFYTLVETKIGR